MKYVRPGNVTDAVEAMRNDPDAVYLAGGTQVNRAPLDRERPAAVVDIREAVSGGIIEEGTDVVIGAMATLQDIADSEAVPRALREAAGNIPTRSVRNQATIGGNIAAGRPDSYLIPVLIALSGTVRTVEGSLPVEEYVLGGHRELIIDVHVPVPIGPCVAVKESRSHLALPVVSAAVSLTPGDEASDGAPSGACVAVGCVAPKVLRLRIVEQGIVSGALVDRAAVEKAVREEIRPEADILGSAEYKTYINGVVVADAVVRCLEALS